MHPQRKSCARLAHARRQRWTSHRRRHGDWLSRRRHLLAADRRRRHGNSSDRSRWAGVVDRAVAGLDCGHRSRYAKSASDNRYDRSRRRRRNLQRRHRQKRRRFLPLRPRFCWPHGLRLLVGRQGRTRLQADRDPLQRHVGNVQEQSDCGEFPRFRRGPSLPPGAH